jgi:hypothetical protein
MANVVVESTKKITLILNEEEAQYLKGMLQNAPHFVDMQYTEHGQDTKIREELFTLISKSL